MSQVEATMSRRRRAAAASRQRPPAQEEPRRRRKPKKPKKRVPTVDVHIRIGLEDMLIRVSLADWQKIVMYWMLGAEDLILRGPFQGMETDIVIRGHDGGMVSQRPRNPETQRAQVPKFKVVRAVEKRREMLEQAGL